MQALLRAGTALAGIVVAGSALAADLPRRAAPPPIFTPVPVFTWTGFYAGFNAGYGFGTNESRGATVIAIPGALTSQGGGVAAAGFSNRDSNDGFVGGGQIGYNYQLTPGSGVVVGIEADAQYVDFGRRRNAVGLFDAAGGALTAAPGVTFVNPNGVSSLDYFGTVRGRLGYAFDRTLVYATGGFAYGSGGGREFGLPGASSDEFKTGYAVGGGVEYALPTDSFLNFFKSSAVTFKVEGLYVNLDQGRRLNGAYAFDAANTYSVPANGTVLAGSIARRDTEFAVVRAGINYKFGSY
ncbi:porin [Methylobacterium sp. Leaf456]|uniref:outer membrane protein n=1 Tax=Methylobacterium sp. Leaf456 TaxID=1736382 RepID=UPI0006F3249B|nr:outer membrane beta-barrel protein [Methylobacterium sp. Leaf456]KQT49274.1 porin [Methylobacterium sp. Leaf456]